jgi:hypothetical protein
MEPAPPGSTGRSERLAGEAGSGVFQSTSGYRDVAADRKDHEPAPRYPETA